MDLGLERVAIGGICSFLKQILDGRYLPGTWLYFLSERAAAKPGAPQWRGYPSASRPSLAPGGVVDDAARRRGERHADSSWSKADSSWWKQQQSGAASSIRILRCRSSSRAAWRVACIFVVFEGRFARQQQSGAASGMRSRRGQSSRRAAQQVAWLM